MSPTGKLYRRLLRPEYKIWCFYYYISIIYFICFCICITADVWTVGWTKHTLWGCVREYFNSVVFYLSKRSKYLLHQRTVETLGWWCSLWLAIQLPTTPHPISLPSIPHWVSESRRREIRLYLVSTLEPTWPQTSSSPSEWRSQKTNYEVEELGASAPSEQLHSLTVKSDLLTMTITDVYHAAGTYWLICSVFLTPVNLFVVK